MEADRVGRKLSAILAADVSGYSRLMSIDEEGTLARLSAHLRDHIVPAVGRFRGRVVKTTGDGLLAEFQSVVDAVRCAVEIQTGMAARNADIGDDKRLDFRIGVNVGDIVEQDGDIFGEGVNIAARLEGIAEPGGICVSERVREDVDGKVGLPFEDAGEQSLRNIARPIRAYRLHPDPGRAPPKRAELSLPDRPSIAVLPFQNMSDDAQQDYFADGMVEDITTALSRMRWLFVIARNSSFAYKGRAVDVKQVGRELGVRYLLEGSVRKAGNRVRITGQLIDTATAAHLWAERFDGKLENIFDLQDQVTASVVGAIAPKLEQAEIERAKRKPTESLDAYDYFLRGMSAFYQWTKEGNDEAMALFYKATELDPNYAAAFGMAARCYGQRKTRGWMVDRVKESAEATRLARRAAELGKDDAVALYSAGVILVWIAGDLATGDALIDQALVLNPNLAWAWLYSGWVKVVLGEPAQAIEREERAMRLSPHDPLTFIMQSAVAAGHFLLGHYAEALAWAELSMHQQPNYILSSAVAAAAAAAADNDEAAARAMARLRETAPEMKISNMVQYLVPLLRAEDYSRFVAAMRKAGLPE